MKRQLSDDEKNFCKKMIKRLEEEQETLKRKDKYFVLMLDEGGLKDSFEKQRREYEAQRKEIRDRMSEIELTKIEMRTQIVDGVEVKSEQIDTGKVGTASGFVVRASDSVKVGEVRINPADYFDFEAILKEKIVKK